MTSGVGQPAPAATRIPLPAEPPADGSVHPARIALGLAILAAQRIGRKAPPNGAFVVGVGLLQQTAEDAWMLARRGLGPPVRVVARAFDHRSRNGRPTVLARVSAGARRRGETTIVAARAEASAFVRSMLADGFAWAQYRAVPQLVNGLLPDLIERVAPQVINGIMPMVRARVLPALIEDIARDPRIRHLVIEEGRSAASGATDYLRTAAANADDRIERAVHRLGRARRGASGGQRAR